MATITLGSNTYTLVALPAAPGFAEITLAMMDSIAVVESPYVPSQTQQQQWPGADRWSLQATLPKMQRKLAVEWIAFLAALQGRLNVFQVGDPLGAHPCGVAKGAPEVNGTISGGNAVGQNVLDTKGWTPSLYRQLLPGDWLQVGYRLYMVTAQVNSDASGKAQIAIYPSLRETPADGAAVVLQNAVGVFRLATNQRQWHTTVDRMIQIGFQAVEAR